MSDADLVAGATGTINEGSKSFAAAARLFDRPTRESAVLLYAWCRYCDDAVDDQVLGFRPAGLANPDAPHVPAAHSSFSLPHAEVAAEGGPRSTHDGGASFEARLRRAPQDEEGGGQAGFSKEDPVLSLERQTRAALGDGPLFHPAFAGLREVVRRHAVPERLPLQHLDGFRMDVAGRRYRTIVDTLDYAYHVAGVVGVMMARIMGVEDEDTLDRASDLGIAFQLTNIARDIVDDARAGRVYVPADWLAGAGIPVDTLADPAHRDRLAPVAARLLDEAEPYYASAQVGIARLPRRSAWAIGAAHGIYRQIGLEIRARGPRAWDQRVSTSSAQKVRFVGMAGLRALGPRGRPASDLARTGFYQRPA